jgi:sugar/nucleoside kinase (ribokinase family)
MDILVVGSIALDTVQTPYGSVREAAGGSALYFSAAASFFNPVNVVAVVGKDFNFKCIDFFKKRNINVDGIYVADGQTFRWGGKYYSNFNQRDTLYTHLNVFENFKPIIPSAYRRSKYIFLANIDPQLQLDVLQQVKEPRLVVLDTMNFWISGKREILLQVIKKSHILILNDDEVRQLTGTDQLIPAGRKILELGPRYLVIKKGEHGAILLGHHSYFTAPAYPVEKVVDPTGAGDSFAGGFVGYLAKYRKMDEVTLRKAVVFGNTIASFNVEDFSFKRLQNLSHSDLLSRMKRFKTFTTF